LTSMHLLSYPAGRPDPSLGFVLSSTSTFSSSTRMHFAPPWVR